LICGVHHRVYDQHLVDHHSTRASRRYDPGQGPDYPILVSAGIAIDRNCRRSAVSLLLREAEALEAAGLSE
jgi:hypothetical protein